MEVTNWSEMRIACEAGGEDVILSSSFNAGSYPGSIDFSGVACVIRGQGQTLDAAMTLESGGNTSTSLKRFFSGSGPGSRLEVHALTLKNGEVSSVGSIYADDLKSGGAIYAYNADLQFYNVTFETNLASQGGAIHINGGSMITNGTKFYSNVATTYYGGAVYCTQANVTIYSSTFESNSATVYGGAIRVDGGSLEIHDSSFESNVAHDGAAVYAKRGVGQSGYVEDLANVKVYGVTFQSNSAGSNGAAIYAHKVNVEMHHTEFKSNYAANNGGALHVTGIEYSSSAKVAIYTSSFESNSATNVSGLC
jgi:predicted outer membrane repeat protein